jgi:peptidoglycan/LPS O-acetylase OafA/YrhL
MAAPWRSAATAAPSGGGGRSACVPINYWPAAPTALGHLWSIACEIQFYAVAPIVLLLGRGRPLVWLGLVAALMTGGMLAPVLDPAGVDKYHFEYAVWPMMLGFCCERWKDSFQQLHAGIVRTATAVFVGGLFLTVFGVETKKLVIATGALALLPCLNAYVSGGEVGGVPGRGLAWLGQRTYSIYLWQQPLTICGYLPAALHPLGALASTAVGALSFRWFERPFLSPSRRSERRQEPLSSPAEWASSSA